MTKKKVELLAPAGNPEGFYGAVNAGADAVYLAGSRFGARAYAENFSETELVECIKYAHLFDRKIYLTVNTLIKENEFSDLIEYINPYYEAGLDGMIIQDIGVFIFIRDHFPGLELHVSTQMTLTGKYGAGILKKMGASRIVPARELSLEEIRYIKSATGLELEVFIHGAMCYCYSGQCLFSSIVGGRSGNRGRCAQPCRLPYRINSERDTLAECYPLSMKDMCTIDHIPELIRAGVDSFKIEGRMKKPEYTAGVTSVYRKYIDRYYEQPDMALQIEPEDRKLLGSLYIRSGLQKGYYFHKNGADMITLDSPSYGGNDEAMLEMVKNRYLADIPKKKVRIKGSFLSGQKAHVTLTAGKHTRTIYGGMVEAAMNQPLTEENIRKQLGKLGDTFWEAEEIIVELDREVFFPLKEINELRRQAVTALTEAITGSEVRRVSGMEAVYPVNSLKPGKLKTKLEGLSVYVRTKEQLSVLYEFMTSDLVKYFYRIYLDTDMFEDDNELSAALTYLSGKIPVYMALPYVLRKEDESYLANILKLFDFPGIQGCMVRSLEGYAYLRDHDYIGEYVSDTGIYIWNRQSVLFWQDKLQSASLPLELNKKEQRQLLQASDSLPFEKIVYGRIPMMITANCIAKTAWGCGGPKKKSVFLTDRLHKKFPVITNCRHCYNIIYNCVPLSLHGEALKWKNNTGLRMDFTIEDADEMTSILRCFLDLLEYGEKRGNLPFHEYTTGHEKRGVE